MTLTNLPPNPPTTSQTNSKPTLHQHPPDSTTLIASVQTSRKFVRPISLRAKLLIGFSMVFSIVFAGTYYWFYTFTTEKTINRLRDTMESTLRGAMAGIDVEDLVALYETGEINEAGFSDDPRYLEQLQWFDTVRSIEPRAWLYSYVIEPIDSAPPRENAITLPPDHQEYEIIYLVDVWANQDPSKAAGFLESDAPAGGTARRAILEGELVEEPDIYTDRWGTWMSAFVPLRDENGAVVAGLGLDIEADYVFQVQQAIRNRVLVSFSITYGVLFVLIYTLSGVLTQHLTRLTDSAEQIGAGSYSLPLPLARQSILPDELDRLAQVFETMVNRIRSREQTIRESRRIEDEIRHALKEEREINELKSRFVSMVSHEMRTPLTIIRTSSELLEKYGHLASNEQRLEYYRRIRAAISNMTQMLEDVLTLGRSDAGKLEFKPTFFDLTHFCREIVEEMRLGIGIGYTITLECGNDCEQAYLDPALLRSILTNLLSNAIKYSPKSSLVVLRLSCEGGKATFEVQDQGIGIPSEDQPRLFELFHRASNVTTIRGTGLGLAIVKQCVAKHEGDVKFISRIGEGTTFTVTLPIEKKQSFERAICTEL